MIARLLATSALVIAMPAVAQGTNPFAKPSTLPYQAPDFRIIKDVNNIGIRAKYEDLGTKEDIERATVLYRAPERLPTGTFTVTHTFPEKGHFIGMVIARHPETGKEFISVFPFAVGIFRWGTILTRIGLILVLVGGVAAFLITRAMRKSA